MSAVDTQSLSLPNGVVLQLLLDGPHLLGLGEIVIAGVPVRSGQVPLRPVIRTGHGVVYRQYRLEEMREEGEATVIATTALGEPQLYGEWRDEYDFPMAWPRLQPEAYADRVEWLLRPERLTLEGVEYTGFSYALRYASGERQIHQVTIEATWELGGRADGNTLLYQGQVNPPVHCCTPEA